MVNPSVQYMDCSCEKLVPENKSRAGLNPRLLTAMLDPDQIVFSNSFLVVLEDRFPKSEKHFLVIPRKDIPTIRDVTLEDLELLKAMEMFGREIAKENGGNRTFKTGYHAEPTMYRLHLHVLSTDMCGPGMDSKRHWNSFTTPFFVESKKAIKELQQNGKIDLPTTSQCMRYLKEPLKCHKCSYSTNNIVDLNDHLLSHLK